MPILNPNSNRKGKSLLVFPSNYTVIDLETTGTDARTCDIIEVACIKYRGNQPVARLVTLIQPPQGCMLSPFIINLTGIRPAMLQNAPRFAEVAGSVWNFLEGETILGHNVPFDIGFLSENFDRLYGRRLCNDYVDTLRLSRKVLPELSHHKLTDLCDYYAITTIHHRAEADCDSTQQVMIQLRQTAVRKQIDIPHL